MVLCWTGGPPAWAAPDQSTKDRCARYAQRAVQQYQLMMSHPQCQVKPDLRWQDNVDNHYNGCLMVPEFLRKSEESARDDHLTACGGLADAAPAPAPASAPAPDPSAAAAPSPAPPPAVPPPAGSAARAPAWVPPVPQSALPAGSIWVREASYGSNVDSVRAIDNALADIATQCNGKYDCTYVVDVRRIGDPFVNRPKDYQVLYFCGTTMVKRASAPAEAGYGSRVQLTCTPAPAPAAKPAPTAAAAKPAEPVNHKAPAKP
jgi:hypothetical protein